MTNLTVSEILENMVENTVMFLTKDLPSLLGQVRVAQIRRQHKDDILKNLPEAERQINELLEALITTEQLAILNRLLEKKQGIEDLYGLGGVDYFVPIEDIQQQIDSLKQEDKDNMNPKEEGRI